MLRILDKNSNPLERNSLKFTEIENSPYLSIELKVKNESERKIVNPGLFLIPSSLDGDIFSFSNKTPESMLQKILLDMAIKVLGEGIPQNSFFNFNNGSREDNKIVIAPFLDPSEYMSITLIFNKSTFQDVEFLYVGLEAK
jgi:hypothetical protein